MAQGLTISVIFKAMSLNYGESLGNISELKKLNSGDSTFTYISRQAIRYELYKSLTENFKMDNAKDSPLDKAQGVVQFKSDTNAAKYAEADLFGYMKTSRGSGSIIRPAVVRVTPAIALEPFLNDVEFGTNKNFADRINEDPDPFQFEHQLSLYTYTMTIDLDRVGKDENDGSEVEAAEKYNRVAMVLDAVQLLNREIKGRTENMNPLFVIGGVYPIKNPFFLGRIKTEYNKDKKGYDINTDLLKSVLKQEYSLNGEGIKVLNNSQVGMIEGFWSNEIEIKELIPLKKDDKEEVDNAEKSEKEKEKEKEKNTNNHFSLHSFFTHLKFQVKEYYGITSN